MKTIEKFQTIIGLLAVAVSIILASFIIRPGRFEAKQRTLDGRHSPNFEVFDNRSGTFK